MLFSPVVLLSDDRSLIEKCNLEEVKIQEILVKFGLSIVWYLMMPFRTAAQHPYDDVSPSPSSIKDGLIAHGFTSSVHLSNSLFLCNIVNRINAT